MFILYQGKKIIKIFTRLAYYGCGKKTRKMECRFQNFHLSCMQNYLSRL